MYLFKRDNYYHISYFDEQQNKTRRISTGKKKKADALKFLSEFSANIKTKPEIRHITLSEFSQEYLKHVKLNHSHSYYGTVTITLNLLQRFLSDIPLSKITGKQMEVYFAETYQRTKQGARTYFIALRSAFNKAIDWQYLTENPLSKVKIPKMPKNNPIFLSESELNTVLENEKCPKLKDIYLFAFHTGMRLSEILNCRWKSINLNERIIRILNTEDFTTKSRKERVIPVNDTLYNLLLRNYPKEMEPDKENLLFSNKGYKYNKDFISHRFKKAVRASTINPEIHFHDLRHSFASNMVKKGVSIFVVKELLGHSDVKTTQIYSHLTIDSLKDAVKMLG